MLLGSRTASLPRGRMDNSKLKKLPSLDRASTLCEEDGQNSYMGYLNLQLRYLFPKFVENLHAQSPHDREMSRAAVIEYHDSSSSQKRFMNSKNLSGYFEDEPITKPSMPRRRLFLLEDLSRDYINILGSQLRIPPSFFGAHWADPTHPNFNYWNPFCRYAEENFVIRYASTQPVRIDASIDVHGFIYQFDANVNRHVQCYDPRGPIVDQPKSYHALSFWSSGERDDGSWDCKHTGNSSDYLLLM